MSPNSPIPLGRFAWLVLIAVIAAPTAFFVLVTPKEPEEPSAPPVEKRALSKLESVGLRENRDWDGLPEMFDVWADKIEWVNGKTVFAFWNPGSRSYSYFFEATRPHGRLRLREVRSGDLDTQWLFPSTDLTGNQSETHPFLFATGRIPHSDPWPLTLDKEQVLKDRPVAPRKVEIETVPTRRP